jgi:hypothetical protein
MFRLALLVLCAGLVAIDSIAADEAVRRDGTRVSGALSLAADERFAFRAGERNEAIESLEFIRFAAKPASPGALLWHQIRLVNEDTILAELLRLDERNLYVRTAWTDKLAVPRAVIERVTHAPGWRPLLVDTFDRGLVAALASGEPRVESGKVALRMAGQGVEWSLKSKLPAGRVQVGFTSARTTTRRATLELDFGNESTVRLELIGPSEHYGVQSPAKADYQGQCRREAGMRRATVDFDRDRLGIFVDELALWSQKGVPGELRAVKVVAGGDGNEVAAIDDILIASPHRASEPGSWAELGADAIRSPENDESFGSLSALGPAGLTLAIKKSKAAYSWPEVAEFAFRRAAIVERATAGEHARLRLRAAEAIRDNLTGAVRKFDDTSLIIDHALLGQLTIPRRRLEEIRPLFHGRNVPIDATPRHLGSRSASGFAVVRPEGLRFVKSVELPAGSHKSIVVIDAARVGAETTPVEILVDGEAVGVLNRFADRASAKVRSYRLPLTNAARRRIEIEIRVRQPESGGRAAGVDLRAVRLELHDKR